MMAYMVLSVVTVENAFLHCPYERQICYLHTESRSFFSFTVESAIVTYITQSVADLRCNLRTCPLDKLNITVSHIHIFLCQLVFMAI